MDRKSAWEIFVNKNRQTVAINRYDRKQDRTYAPHQITAASWKRIAALMARPEWPTRYEDSVWFNVSNVRMH